MLWGNERSKIERPEGGVWRGTGFKGGTEESVTLSGAAELVCGRKAWEPGEMVCRRKAVSGRRMGAAGTPNVLEEWWPETRRCETQMADSESGVPEAARRRPVGNGRGALRTVHRSSTGEPWPQGHVNGWESWMPQWDNAKTGTGRSRGNANHFHWRLTSTFIYFTNKTS